MTTTIRRVGHKRMFYVEVEHHGHGSAAYVGGPGQGAATEADARARAKDMPSAHVARCRAIGPEDGQDRDTTTGRSLCPDDGSAR